MIVVAIIGVLAALAIYGVRAYLAAAKTGEAKNTVGAVARLAASRYDSEVIKPEVLPEGSTSEQSTHVLCKSAVPVPNNISAVQGRKYQPRKDPGFDWGTGDQLNGWNCLGFSISEPIYYQYHYYQDSGYLSPPKGGPDPGSGGFEAAAVGDLDADGFESLFARVGAVSLTTLELRLSTQVFVSNEYE